MSRGSGATLPWATPAFKIKRSFLLHRSRFGESIIFFFISTNIHFQNSINLFYWPFWKSDHWRGAPTHLVDVEINLNFNQYIHFQNSINLFYSAKEDLSRPADQREAQVMIDPKLFCNEKIRVIFVGFIKTINAFIKKLSFFEEKEFKTFLKVGLQYTASCNTIV